MIVIIDLLCIHMHIHILFNFPNRWKRIWKKYKTGIIYESFPLLQESYYPLFNNKVSTTSDSACSYVLLHTYYIVQTKL